MVHQPVCATHFSFPTTSALTLVVVPVEKIRSDKGLPLLQTYVIDVISHSEESLDAADAEALRRTKMSSTFIREWIVQQQRTKT